MTRERKLAIEMWTGIINGLKKDKNFNLCQYKEDFCDEHGLEWLNYCWFCQYIGICSKCPLRNCLNVDGKRKGPYLRATRGDVSGAKFILKCLKNASLYKRKKHKKNLKLMEI